MSANRGERWDGGYIRTDSRGRRVYWIRRMIMGQRYEVSTRRSTEEAALAELVRFESDPWNYTPDCDRALLDPAKGEPPVLAGVYFLQCTVTTYIKIGWSSNIRSRISGLQVASPTLFRFLGWLPPTEADEKVLHARFAKSHVRGEWFRPSASLHRYIQATVQGVPE